MKDYQQLIGYSFLALALYFGLAELGYQLDRGLGDIDIAHHGYIQD